MCPYFPDAKRIHGSFDDPAQATGSDVERMRVFRQVRLEMKTKLELWLNTDRHRPDLTPVERNDCCPSHPVLMLALPPATLSN